MVRILCVHGIGTNGSIFQIQSASLRSLLPAHWEFEFYDAEVECGPAPGIGAIYPGPYLCPYKVPSIVCINEAIDGIRDFVESEGPFDGAWGFSAGGAVLLSMLLDHQLKNPYASPPFRHALLICTGLPFSVDYTHGVDVTPLILHRRVIPVPLPELLRAVQDAKEAGDFDPANPGAQEGVPPALVDVVAELDRGEYRYENYVSRRWDESHDKIRLAGVACGFVIGKQDEICESAREVVKLVDAKHMIGVVDHPGGHEIPKDRASQQKIADMALKVVARSELF